MADKQALGARGRLLCHPRQRQAGLRQCDGGSPGAGKGGPQGDGCTSRQAARLGIATWRQPALVKEEAQKRWRLTNFIENSMIHAASVVYALAEVWDFAR
jgi:hypothetical protein